jgi:ribosome recycling factor
MIRGTNILVINPYDAEHRDPIIKAVETSKMDVQITTEDSNVVVTLGAIPQDMKNECIQSAKKLYDKSKDSVKNIRHGLISEIKKLEKIISKDESKRIEKNILENIDK